MASVGLSPPWRAYKTAEGKEYYYNTQTKVTTWDHPTSSKNASKRESKNTSAVRKTSGSNNFKQDSKPRSSPVEGAGRGGLLAQIQQGAKLKKVDTNEKSTLSATINEKGTNESNNGAGPMEGMSAMLNAIRSGGNLKKSFNRQENGSSEVPDSTARSEGVANSGAGGGLAEIMKKSREAAARRGTANTGTSSSTSSYTTTPQYGSTTSAGRDASPKSDVEQRLKQLELKMDKLLAHFGIA
uniref:AlNc14C238G9426 protein n=1 Tax=Albugo laibachii Nc14 TaxID=890382 RepID=F0WST0_9STRA|nr:AlNc14C238G9426 [Albugo laibachii Nc14]|eukprot:CCA24408.1 AlNc14C238G9426 [Albugo laibachii Nc14]